MKAKLVNEAIRHLTPRTPEEIKKNILTPPVTFETIQMAKQYGVELSEKDLEEYRTTAVGKLQKNIEDNHLKAHIAHSSGNDLALVYIEDVRAAAALGTPNWPISREGHEATSLFNGTYGLSKFKKAYFLFDFIKNLKFWIIVEPDGGITTMFDMNNKKINNPTQFLQTNYPEL